MKKISFSRDWLFTLERNLEHFNGFGFTKCTDASGAAARFYRHSNWERIDLPHDFALAMRRDPNADTFAGAYPDTHHHRFMTEERSEASDIAHIGWYRKEFTLDPSAEGKRIFLSFEGIFRDATIWVNGIYLDRHLSGYTSFTLEITDFLFPGEENSIAVRVDSDQPEGWWYEGAGIYRPVYLLVAEPIYFTPAKLFLRPQADGTVAASAEIFNANEFACTAEVSYRILDATGREITRTQATVQLPAEASTPTEAICHVPAPHLWDLDTPYLYTLTACIGEETEEVSFGFRTVTLDPAHGLFLNGKHVKIHGACVHQDFGGVGVALSDNLQAYKVARLKEMGVNAYRCSHHAPSPALLDACDRLGMLVMDETRMFGTSPEALRQLTDCIERDRNHPSVFIYSLGNEEFSIQNTPFGHRTMQKVSRIAKALDPTRAVTYGANNGSDFIGINGAAEVRGVNYIRNDIDGFWLDRYHEAHPQQPILGTEESSYVLSRGGAINDTERGLLDAFGDVTMPWGSTPKGWVKYFEERDYLAGSFMWTGFDYRGEPNPFEYTKVASSFGTIDLCGMEKPPFYYYKAWWTDEPTLKLAPHWNHTLGETVTVTVFTNCERITLYLNGEKLDEREVARFDAPQFTLPFTPGTLAVEGIRNGQRLRDEMTTAGAVAKIRTDKVLSAHRAEDVAIYELSAYDKDGVFCPLADDELTVTVTGGRLIGVGNGDPASLAPEHAPVTEEALYIRKLSVDGMSYAIPAKRSNTRVPRYDRIEYEGAREDYADDYRLVVRHVKQQTKPQRAEYTARFFDAEAYEYIEFERLGENAEVYLNGERLGDTRSDPHANVRPYRFYAKFLPGENLCRIVADRGEDTPPAVSGYVKLGRSVTAPLTVRLHYGRARVFVSSDHPENLSVSAVIKK